jgi:hypothetical protein
MNGGFLHDKQQIACLKIKKEVGYRKKDDGYNITFKIRST